MKTPTHTLMGTPYPKGVKPSKERMYHLKAVEKAKSKALKKAK